MFYSQQTVGVIVRLEKEAFKVLTQHGKEMNAKPHALQLRKSRGVALDSRQVHVHVYTVLFIGLMLLHSDFFSFFYLERNNFTRRG